ncbi:MAE_28990/MAE_18760 family HEPN-like nuclease [Hyalangium rubrum]|uniref:MAE_28990/MAE_18760 family HEPN-like nuclease n=1 Tax=Hyalangium rubrum TaxID=3103134 RepID=A0ABU5H7C1_9BACT|nr:MAE_28990/MAE_18760 family HEPN-like nuclease [Hyalangium sp. s54d21]MDY7229027.1 MAE_28990/MAE_18760 family HEPN-like nuclease [Hyalangium sp. s54d21]
MTTLRGEFEIRKKEIEGYFSFIEMIASDGATVSFVDTEGNPVSRPVDKDVAKTLKAAGFLLLYNLVESAMTNAIGAIFDELKQKRVNFDTVREELKRVAIDNLKRNGGRDLHASIQDLSVDILTAAFDRSKIFSGNLDARKIREAAEEYGFSATTNARLTNNGKSLLTVKTNRNDLGHGDKSFSEVGRDYEMMRLAEIKTEAIAYLSDIIGNIEKYISEMHYLAAPPNS